MAIGSVRNWTLVQKRLIVFIVKKKYFIFTLRIADCLRVADNDCLRVADNDCLRVADNINFFFTFYSARIFVKTHSGEGGSSFT